MLGQRIQSLRKSYQMSMASLAHRVGKSIQTISNWENDNVMPSVEMLIRLADVFHVTTDYLLELDNKRYLDVQGLTEEQISHVQLLIEDIRGTLPKRENAPD